MNGLHEQEVLSINAAIGRERINFEKDK